MFTIKHIDDYGNENLFQAESVQVHRGKGDPRDGVEVTGVVSQDYSGVHYPFRSPSDPREQTGYEAALYVMNEAGATVAKYLL